LWATDHKIPVFPAKEYLYLEHLGETKGSKAAIEEAVNAMVWVHSLTGLPSPTASPFVHIVLDGLRRAQYRRRNLLQPRC